MINRILGKYTKKNDKNKSGKYNKLDFLNEEENLFMG
jgi:hypothetical protein